MFFISDAHAQTAAAGGVEGFFGGMTPFILIMFAVMYFFMIRPQQKLAKERKAMMDALAKGDEVVTSSGILGKITKITDAYVAIEVSAGTEILVQKSFVNTLLPKGTIKSI